MLAGSLNKKAFFTSKFFPLRRCLALSPTGLLIAALVLPLLYI
ncbi:hypothetical protein V1277_005706 [Bradyrhizobium sp. AZCC 1588]